MPERHTVPLPSAECDNHSRCNQTTSMKCGLYTIAIAHQSGVDTDWASICGRTEVRSTLTIGPALVYQCADPMTTAAMHLPAYMHRAHPGFRHMHQQMCSSAGARSPTHREPNANARHSNKGCVVMANSACAASTRISLRLGKRFLEHNTSDLRSESSAGRLTSPRRKTPHKHACQRMHAALPKCMTR